MSNPAAWGEFTQNELDSVVKRDLYGKAKTDDVTLGQIGPANELIYTSPVVPGTSVWVAADVLKSSSPSSAVSAGVATKQSYVKMTSLYGATSTLAVCQSGVTALTGVSWQANDAGSPAVAIGNWIDSSYGIPYTPKFVIVAAGTVPLSDGSNLTSANSAPIANNTSCPFTFDVNTGVLTFLNGPAVSGSGATFAYNLASASGSPRYTSYDLYVSGYTYAGPTVTASTYGGSGGGTSTQLVQNIGLNAFVQGATASSTYVARNGGALTYNFTLFGNSTVYDVLFNYGSGTSPLYVGGTQTPLTTIDVTSMRYNNSGAQGTATYGTSQNKQAITHVFSTGPSSISTYSIPVSISTLKAGGTGVGSTYTFSIPITVSPPDNMGNATLLSFNAAFSWNGATGWVDGISYYISPTTVTIPQYSMRVLDIFNIVGAVTPSSTAGLTAAAEAAAITYFSASGAASGSDTATDLVVTNNRSTSFASSLITSSPGAYAPGGTGYMNSSSVALTVLANNSQIYATFNNILNEYSSAIAIFPAVGSGLGSYGGSCTYMGYFPNNPTLNESNVLSSTTVGGFQYLNRISMGSYTTLPPTLTGSLSNNGNSLGALPVIPTYAFWNSYDAVVNPLDYGVYGVYTLNGSDFTTTLNSTYILPSTAQIHATTYKYVALRMNTASKLSTFSIRWSSPDSSCVVTGFQVAWVYNGVVYGWYDNSNSGNTSTGCDNTGSTNTVRNIAINSYGGTPAIQAYNTATGGTSTDIYIVMQFTGKISLNSFIVQ